MHQSSKLSFYSLALAAALIIISCTSNTNQDRKDGGQELKQDVNIRLTAGTFYNKLTGANGKIKYALYVPQGYTLNAALPAIIFTDPQAAGQIPLLKYQKLADRYNYMLVGSLDSRNGMDLETSTPLIGELIGETMNNLGADRSAVSLMGFSGGAKIALAAASSLPGINTVIYCGAAFPQGSMNVPLPTLGITGLFDMNFTEVLYYAASLDSTPGKNAFLLTAGKHEWPDTNAFKRVVAWEKASRCRGGKSCDSLILNNLKKEIQSDLNKTVDPVWLDFDLRYYCSVFTGIFDIRAEEQQRAVNTSGAAYKNSLQRFTNDIARESEGRRVLSQAFNEKDLEWWQQTIKILRQNPNDLVNNRLTGFISLGAYSYSRKSVDAGHVESAAKYLRLYRLADPENPEWAFLSACLEERNGNRRNAMTFLETAVQLGLKDTAKITREPLLISAHGDPKYEELVSRAAR